jgi:Zn-dependent membrane protease YugP
MHGMHLVLPILLLLSILIGPHLWVRRVLRRYSQPADRYEGTGGQLARHLLDHLGLSSVSVEETEQGDHYDPRDKTVRLGADHFNGRSLTAVTIAAHEVGHALQDAQGFPPLRARTRLVMWSRHAERLGAGMLMAAPVIGIATRAPAVTGLMLLGGLLSLGSTALVHLVTLPTEFDASFGRAMPILEQGEYLHRPDYPHARRLLKAAALTYVSASLMSLLNVARWWAILRR